MVLPRAGARGTAWLDAYMEGKIYSLSETGYAQDSVPLATFYYSGDPIPNQPNWTLPMTWDHIHYTGFSAYWVRPVWEKAILFDGNGTWNATRKDYQYLTSDQGGAQYGNVTRLIESGWTGSGLQLTGPRACFSIRIRAEANI